MSIDDPLISVIIPAYNHEKYVQEAIKSIISQTYKNLELIIVDDGSTDKTWDKINELKTECEKRFIRLILKRQENSGTIKVFDDTLRIANGKYIYYIASDDIAHHEAISTLYKNIGDAGLIFPDLALIDSEGKRFFFDENSQKTYDIKNAKYKTMHEFYTDVHFPDIDSNDFDYYYTLLNWNCCNIGFLLLKQAALEAGGWKKDTIIEDYYMHLQIAKKYRIKRLKKILFFYRKHNSNWSSNLEQMTDGVKEFL